MVPIANVWMRADGGNGNGRMGLGNGKEFRYWRNEFEELLSE